MQNNITWLHLSDWHQKGEDFDREMVRDALLRDIRERAAISPGLEKIDFMVFSGDLAFSGKAEEYRAAIEIFIEPVLQAAGLDKNSLLIVPGNHDLDRDDFELLPAVLQQPLTDEKQVQKWLIDERRRESLLKPFDAYHNFISEYLGKEQSAYISVRRFAAGGREIGLLGLNSAWMCGRGGKDYGALLAGEPQINEGLKKIAGADLRIAVLHHSFEWLAEFDRERIKTRLCMECDLVLCGHQHRQRVEVFDGTTKCVIIPAGAGYEQRIATNPRYVNSYNFVHLDSANECIVYLRRWSDQNNAWLADTETAEQGKLAFSLPKRTFPLPPDANNTQFLGDLPEDWLHAWYRHVIAGCRRLPLEVIDPKLLAGERDAGAMRLDEIYVELDVLHHSPDHSEQPPEAKQAEQAKKALKFLERERRAVLLGDPGSGKTTFVNYLA
ncbi:MAG: hypothetical protein GY862_05550, partial [Gammaproteobacteria bacterium]|nr:hypothetical protein [Gammaproteobacteria bacterium]